MRTMKVRHVVIIAWILYAMGVSVLLQTILT